MWNEPTYYVISMGLKTNNGVKAMNPKVWKPRQTTGRRLRDTNDGKRSAVAVLQLVAGR